MRMKRRAFLGQVLAGVAAPAIGAAFPRMAGAATGGAAPVVRTRHGPVRGETRDGVHSFLGVRYGAPVGRGARFRPARPPRPWREPVVATAYGPACAQSDPAGPAPAERESEDCLTLNVWTPGLGDGRKRPVMVWLHGGGLWRLSAAGPAQAGDQLARHHDAVMVSPNHRLGVFGFLHLEAFDRRFAGSAHVGMLDLVLALQWVRDNIAAFGGDPDNVTIFGQSGGGQKVSLLMAMPAAQGLYHKAIIQSGPAPVTLEPAYATDLARRLLRYLGIAEGEAARIEDVPTQDILTAYYKIFHEIGGFGTMGVIQDFAPVVDGRILPQQPFWNGPPPAARGIPLMIGTTRTEMTQYKLQSDPDFWKSDFDGIAQGLRPIFGDDTAALIAHYREAHPAMTPWEVFAAITADWPTRFFSQRIALAQAQQAPVWFYRTDWQTVAHDGLWMAPHAIDIPFVLDTVGREESPEKQRNEQQRMADQMSAAWVAFARNGDPANPRLPQWPRFEPEQRQTMLFNLTSKVVADPDGDDLRALDRNLPHLRVVGGGVTRP